MDFEKIIKISGFLLTIVSLVVAIDYFLNNKFISLAITATLSIIVYLIYLKFRKANEMFDLKILSHEVKIDIQDIRGETALHLRTTKFAALKNKVKTFTDHMSADGEFIESQVKPGLIEEIRREGGDLFLRSTFGKILNKGETADKEISGKLINTFLSNPEYWSVRIILPTKEFKLVIIFPKDRPYTNYCGYQRITSHEKISEIQPIEMILEGRPSLIWTVKNPELKDVYKLVWHW